MLLNLQPYDTLLRKYCDGGCGLSLSVCSVLGHVLGELHEVLPVLHGQQGQDPAVSVHALFVFAEAHVQAGALPHVAYVGGVIFNSCRGQE